MWSLLLAFACADPAADGDTAGDGGSDGGAAAASTTGCALWPVDEGVGDSWSWTRIDGATDGFGDRTETRAGLDGESFRVDDEGSVGAEGQTTTWTASRWYRCDEDGVQLVEVAGTWSIDDWEGTITEQEWSRVWDPPLLLLGPDIAAGASWTYDSTMVATGPDGELAPVEQAGTIEVIARETVSVPAGSFETWKLRGVPDDDTTGSPFSSSDDSWWAAPHGLVATEWQGLSDAP